MRTPDPPVGSIDRHGPTPELPDLDPGFVLLSTDDRTSAALHSLVVDRLLRATGPAWWVDAGGHARTDRLARVAPGGRTLDRVRVARGFTAFQHLAIVETLGDRLLGSTADGASPSDGRADPALVVAPALDAPYRADDCRGEEAREMLLRALSVLAGVARRHDCPVLVTRMGEGGPGAPVAAAADGRIRCESTREGPRFVGEGFETLVYPAAEGWVQTTLAFWERVLAARVPDAPATAAGPAAGSDDGLAPRGSGGDDGSAAPGEVIPRGAH